jgi:hypothetical protein
MPEPLLTPSDASLQSRDPFDWRRFMWGVLFGPAALFATVWRGSLFLLYQPTHAATERVCLFVPFVPPSGNASFNQLRSSLLGTLTLWLAAVSSGFLVAIMLFAFSFGWGKWPEWMIYTLLWGACWVCTIIALDTVRRKPLTAEELGMCSVSHLVDRVDDHSSCLYAW